MSTATEEPMAGVIVPYAPSALEEYRPRIMMAPAEAKAMDDQLRECMLAVLRENVDYGTIPGAGDKKNLLKPGAEKLLQWFGFGSRSAEVKTERDDPEHPGGIADKARRIGVTYRTEVTKTVPGGAEVVVATCEGYAGYDEDRYFIAAEDAVRKAEEKERFWARKDQRQPNPAKWEHATEYRAPWNTIIKMAQKRAYVGAAIDATGAAGLFTQDMEDATAAAVQAGAQAFATAGRTAIGRLPQTVREALDAWYGTLHWPGPDEWDAEQWCTALVKAGGLREAHGRPGESPAKQHETAVNAYEERKATQDAPAVNGNGQHPQATPADDDFYTAADVLTEFTTGAVAFLAEDEGRELWRAVAASAKARDITRDDAKRLQDIIQARITDLRADAEKAERVEGAIVPDPTSAPTARTQDADSARTGTAERADLDPGDPWALKVETVTDQDDAEAAKADVRQQMKTGHLAAARGAAIIAAIDMHVIALRNKAAAA